MQLQNNSLELQQLYVLFKFATTRQRSNAVGVLIFNFGTGGNVDNNNTILVLLKNKNHKGHNTLIPLTKKSKH